MVEDAEKITVIFGEKQKSKAHLVGTDPKTDLALLQIDGPKRGDYPVIAFGNSDQIHEGDWAIAIGSPFGLNRSVSFGIISAKGRAQMGILDVEDFIQTDAAINPGSSGGPLLNTQGELVGVNTAIFSEGGGNMGIGFAVPAKIAREISDALITNGHVPRGWVGMMAQDLDADLARYFKAPSAQGALVSQVSPVGPADQASVQGGDVITQFDHQTVDGAATLKSLVGKECDAGLVIHEGRLIYKRYGLSSLMDIGQEWHTRFQLPIVLGANVIARRLGNKIPELSALLQNSIRYAFEHTSEIVDDLLLKNSERSENQKIKNCYSRKTHHGLSSFAYFIKNAF